MTEWNNTLSYGVCVWRDMFHCSPGRGFSCRNLCFLRFLELYIIYYVDVAWCASALCPNIHHLLLT